MTEHPWVESAAAYALGALDQSDRAAFEAHLAACSRCRTEVATLRETADLLAHAVPAAEPSPGLRERVLAEARRVRPLGRPAPRAAWLLAAACTILAVGLGVLLGRERAAARGARAALAEARRLLAARDSAFGALLSPEVHVVSLSPSGGAPPVRVFWSHDRNVFVVTAFGLPTAPAGRTYQLWALARDKGKAPASMGTFNTDATGHAVLLIPVDSTVLALGLLEACALTEEPAGGSPGPTETPRFVGTWRHTVS